MDIIPNELLGVEVNEFDTDYVSVKKGVPSQVFFYVWVGRRDGCAETDHEPFLFLTLMIREEVG